MADEADDTVNVETTDISTETPTTPETPAVEAPPVVEGAQPAAKSAAEAISAAIEEAGRPRRIQPKQEEQNQNDTRPRNADGTFKAETPEEKATREAAEEEARLAKETPEEKAARLAKETPEQKAAREAKEAAAKKPDHINDPIDPAIKGRTAERMKFLIDTVKAQNTLVEQHGQLFNTIVSSGATPEEFSHMVGYMRLVHSTKPEDMQAAYQVLQSELRGLAQKMGTPIPEVNLLRDPANKDLVDELREGKITNARAHEVALWREQQKSQRTRETATTTQTEQAAKNKADNDAGIAEMNALDLELRGKDGDAVFQAKYDVLVPTLQPIFARLNPREWKGIFLKAYNDLKIAPPALPAAAVTTPAAPKQQPLRPKQPAGAGNSSAGPKSALEAINAALEF